MHKLGFVETGARGEFIGFEISSQIRKSTSMANSGLLRTLLGLLLAPILPGLLIVILVAPFRPGISGFDPRALAEAAWIIKLSGILGYPIAIVLGIPSYIFFRSRGWNSLPIYVTAGALLGLLIYLIYIPLGSYSSNGLSGLSERFSNTARVYIPLGMIFGAIATLFFWLIARPDRTTP
jgi:hypothetical protein